MDFPLTVGPFREQSYGEESTRSQLNKLLFHIQLVYMKKLLGTLVILRGQCVMTCASWFTEGKDIADQVPVGER